MSDQISTSIPAYCDRRLWITFQPAVAQFTSRRGVGPGSISHHPMGVPHGPHPGSYEQSIGATRTDELAVMVDSFAPLRATPAALSVEDVGYQDSFL